MAKKFVNEEADHNRERGNRAGDLIRFFLDGGNDATFDTNDDVAIMVLGCVATMIPEIAFDEILKAAGYREIPGPNGSTHIEKVKS